MVQRLELFSFFGTRGSTLVSESLCKWYCTTSHLVGGRDTGWDDEEKRRLA